jgi:hypothetical protein
LGYTGFGGFAALANQLPTADAAACTVSCHRRVFAGGSATAAAVLKSTCCSVISAVSVEVGHEARRSRLSSSPGPYVVAMSFI